MVAGRTNFGYFSCHKSPRCSLGGGGQSVGVLLAGKLYVFSGKRHKPNRFATTQFYAKIDNHGIRRGDMWRIIARWWRPVATRVALDLLYWAMRSALYRLSRMAIEMAREAGAFFSVINFMSCITVAKQPCYCWLKIKQSYNIVRYYVLIQLVYYGSRPTSMNAVLAIIANGRQAIVVIDTEAVEINYFLL